MKAIILAAGKSERLGNMINIPKPMIEINGKPILEHNIELCKKYGINNIYINLHHLPHTIMKYFGDGKKFGVNIKYSYENKLLGTSGSVRNIIKKYKSFNNNFFVIYGDNYSNYNLDLLKSDSIANIGFHYREDVESSGVAEFDENMRIISFFEKPEKEQISSYWVNAGIYYLSPEIIKYIPEGFSDFSKDIFPKLINNNIPIYGVCSDSDVKAFDTPEMLLKNRF